jgi:DNA adenine methylase
MQVQEEDTTQRSYCLTNFQDHIYGLIEPSMTTQKNTTKKAAESVSGYIPAPNLPLNKKSSGKTLKPFIKWAGGKGQILIDIQNSYPKELGTTITKYAEPFIGGGAVLFDILSKYSLKKIYISDINAELINTYTIIRDNVEDLISLLTRMEENYLPNPTEIRKAIFYEKRERYNDIIINNLNESLETAALFIFLNKTCFNGLYRVNKKGLFNVPVGSYKNPRICDAENLKNISEALQNVTIVCGDYRLSEEFIDENTFVYFDPPYRPLSETASFTSYTEGQFDDQSQKELADYVELLDKKHAKILVSNSDPKNSNPEDNFLDELYSKLVIRRIEANRMINCDGKSRGKISELLISNY